MMLYLKPRLLGSVGLDDALLKADKKACVHCGPCGVGEHALYLNSYWLDRRWYIPVSNIQRAYKRVAMSKGGFTGKGIFGAIPYLVVEYGNGEVKQFTFKHEHHVDMMIAEIQRRFPRIKTISEAAAKKLEEARRAEEARYKKHLSPRAEETLAELRRMQAFLEERPDLATRLAADSKAKRVDQLTNPAYKWAAAAIFAMALVATAYGFHSWMSGTGDSGLYILMVGFSALFFFSSSRVLPTARMNRKAIAASLDKTRAELADYLSAYPGFPLPERYAHPFTVARMIRSVREGRSETVEEAFEDMKAVLKAMNSSVTVNQAEYDEIVAIKPIFLLENYQ